MDREQMDQDQLVRVINDERTQVKIVAAAVKDLAAMAKNADLGPRNGEDVGEEIANLMLAYRHLEDASMRLGKAIQARDGGTSVYDKTTVVGA